MRFLNWEEDSMCREKQVNIQMPMGSTSFMGECHLCPRNCNVDRRKVAGYCGAKDTVKVARAALHYWEEPCISGESGSGTVFFSGCPMHCVFCQNQDIANGNAGKEITEERLAEIFFELQEKGANNINLVTGTHFVPQIAAALRAAKEGKLLTKIRQEQGSHVKKLQIPVVYNSSGYETVETLKLLDGLVDIYLPDFKYWEEETAKRYSNAPDYPKVVKAAIAEMVRQVGEQVFLPKKTTKDDIQSEDCKPGSFSEEEIVMEKGVIVRHLILPGHTKESKEILKYLYETYGDQIYISIMNQYTPMAGIVQRGYPELGRKITKREYDKVIDYAIELGIEQAFIQEGETAEESFIPAFDGEGV